MDFRKIDVDSLDPENLVTKEDLVPPQEPVSAGDIEQRAQQVRGQLQRGDHVGALQLALDSPPYGGDENTKNIHLKTVIEVLSSIRSSDITPAIQQLPTEQQNVLIKYLYKGMGSATGQPHGGVLLNWFEKTVDTAGQGGVIQYMADRRTV